MKDEQEKIEHEKEFWDDDVCLSLSKIKDEDLIVGPEDYHDKMRPHHPYFGVDRINKECIDLLGDIEGKRILDCGCGLGFMTALLAKKGAHVTAIDISPGSLEATMHRARLNKVEDRVETLLMNAEELNFEESSFDGVFGSFVLHHTDLPKARQSLKCVLKPGGRAVFIETSAKNPLLIWARDTLTGKMGIPKYGTMTEQPLSAKDINDFKVFFNGKCDSHFPIFLFFRMAAGYLDFLSGPIPSGILSWLDRKIWKVIKPLRKYSYYKIIVLEN